MLISLKPNTCLFLAICRSSGIERHVLKKNWGEERGSPNKPKLVRQLILFKIFLRISLKKGFFLTIFSSVNSEQVLSYVTDSFGIMSAVCGFFSSRLNEEENNRN